MVEQNNQVSFKEIARVGRFVLREDILNVPKEALEKLVVREICRVGRFALTETVYKIKTLPGDLPLRQTPYPKIIRRE